MNETETKNWTIGQGEFDDEKTFGIYTGTEAQADALVDELNLRDPNPTSLRYWHDEIQAITGVTDVLGDDLPPIERSRS